MLSCVVAGLVLGRGVEYSVRALGAKDQWALVGTALNDGGQVAGYYRVGTGGTMGFVWTDGQLTVIRGEGSVRPTGLDASSGMVVGTISADADQKGRGFMWTRAGGMQFLEVAAGYGFEPMAVSPNGLIAGAIYQGLAANQVGIGTWDMNSGLKQYGGWLAGSRLGSKIDLSAVNSGGIMGGSAGKLGQDWHAVRAMPTQAPVDAVEALADTGAASACTAMNVKGWLGGFVTRSGTKWAAIWSPAGARIDVAPNCVVGGLNGSEVVVGNAFGSKPFAFIWDTENGLRDLNSLVSSQGVRLTAAVGINDAGQVLCTGFQGERPQSFLLTPLGE